MCTPLSNRYFGRVFAISGVYHPSASTSARAIRILNLMVNITSKYKHM